MEYERSLGLQSNLPGMLNIFGVSQSRHEIECEYKLQPFSWIPFYWTQAVNTRHFIRHWRNAVSSWQSRAAHHNWQAEIFQSGDGLALLKVIWFSLGREKNPKLFGLCMWGSKAAEAAVSRSRVLQAPGECFEPKNLEFSTCFVVLVESCWDTYQVKLQQILAKTCSIQFYFRVKSKNRNSNYEYQFVIY